MSVTQRPMPKPPGEQRHEYEREHGGGWRFARHHLRANGLRKDLERDPARGFQIVLVLEDVGVGPKRRMHGDRSEDEDPEGRRDAV